MRAAVFYGAGDVRVEQVAIPTPGPGEILIQVTAVGVCGTDTHEFDNGPHMFPTTTRHPASGHLGPMIMGHEFAGRITALGEGVEGFSVGELVACGAGVSCGECPACVRGRTNLCESYWTLGLNGHGGLAEYVVAPAGICFSAEQWGLSEHLAGIAQPMSIAVHATRRARLTEDDVVVIIGAGGIGAFLVHAVAAVTPQVAVTDLSPERLEIARRNGAKWTHQVGTPGSVAELRDSWGIRPTVIFEVTGTPHGLAAANEWLEPGGRLVLVGLHDGEMPLNYRTTSLIEHELIGTNGHVAWQDFPRALELLATGGGAWDLVAPEVVPLESAVEEGLRPLVERRSTRIKSLIDPRVAEIQPSQFHRA